MLERVERHDDVGKLGGRGPKATPVVNAGGLGFLTGNIQHILPNIDSDHPRGAPSRHFDSLSTFSATEVDDNFSLD